MAASVQAFSTIEEQDPVMGFFIADAHAQIGGGGGDPTFSFIMLIALFAVFYFVLIRPQSKRQKEHKAMVASLSKGDEVVTNGGLLGKITNVGDSFVTVEVADGMEVRVQRMAVAALMPKGTIKSG